MRVSATMRQLGDTRAEKVGLTRFFRNPAVTSAEILRHAAARAAAAAAGRHVLLIQDTTEINYQAKAGRKRGLGRVGNGKDVGLFLHPALALDAADGAVLGLAGAVIWRRDKTKSEDYQTLPIEEKESHKWLAAPRAALAELGAASQVTVIADREADIYELFARLPDARTHLLIRATRDRALGEKGARLFPQIAAQPEAGRLAFDLQGRPGRLARQVTLAVRFKEVALRQPKRGADRRDPRELKLTIIEASEIDAPAGEKPIVWRLLTTHDVASLEDAARMIDFYRRRWVIEQMFRALKSQAVAIEDSLIADGEALERLASAALIAACMVMQLVQARGEAGWFQTASRLFDAGELKVLKALTVKLEGKTQKQKNPHPDGSLAWAAWLIARLGGWNGYASERPPGPITFARGLERFSAIAQGYTLAAN
jgi:hypothetical protein